MLMTPTVWTNDLPGGIADAFAIHPNGIAVDIETSGLDWRTDRMATVQVADPVGGVHIVRLSGGAPRRLAALIGDGRLRKVFHHAMFDLRFMARSWGVMPENVVCTKIASKILNPTDKDHSLKTLLARRLNVAIDKGARTSDWFAPALSDEQLLYAASDVVHLHALMEKLSEELDRRKLKELATNCFAHIPTRLALEIGDYPDVYEY